MDPVRNVDVLGFMVVVELLVNWLVARKGRKTGDVEGGAWSGSVGHIGGSGADTAGAKAREEGSTVVLLGDSHLTEIEGSEGGLSVYLKVREREGDPRGVESKRKDD